MARAVLMLWALAATLGCEGEWTLEAERMPLMIFNTYPGNGVTIAREDVGEIAVTFTEDLGPAEGARQAARRIDLSDEEGIIEILREDLTNVSYDEERFTLRVELDPEVRQRLIPGRYALRVHRDIETTEGVGLPTDYLVRFRITER